jgi:hypothetical protein
VRIWKEWRKDRSIILPILDDIRELGFCFEAFSISLVRPTANHPAHNCAIFACKMWRLMLGLGQVLSF